MGSTAVGIRRHCIQWNIQTMYYKSIYLKHKTLLANVTPIHLIKERKKKIALKDLKQKCQRIILAFSENHRVGSERRRWGVGKVMWGRMEVGRPSRKLIRR